MNLLLLFSSYYNYKCWPWQSKWHGSNYKALIDFHEITEPISSFILKHKANVNWDYSLTVYVAWRHQSVNLKEASKGPIWDRAKVNMKSISTPFSLLIHIPVLLCTVHQCTLFQIKNICLCSHSLKWNYLHHLFFCLLPESPYVLLKRQKNCQTAI